VQSAAARPSRSPADPRAAGRYAAARSTESNEPASDESTVDGKGEGEVTLNFDNADVNEVIATIADLVDIKYVVEPGVQGTVTIRTAGAISKEYLLSVFYLILEVNGLTAVRDGEFFRISAIQDASRLPIVLRVGVEDKPGVHRKEIVTQIIPLQYITAQEMGKLIEPFLSPNATIISHEGTNTLLVVDTGINITKVVKLVRAFDIDLFEETNHRFFFLKNADPGDAVDVLKEVFPPITEGSENGVKFIPIHRLYAFLTLTSDEGVFDKIDQLLLSLDADTEGTEPRLHVYFVKNGTALELANLLGQVFAEAMATGEGEGPKTSSTAGVPRGPGFSATNPLLKGRETRDATPPPAEPPKQAKAPDEVVEEGKTESSTLAGVIKITPDEIRNALIIEATPADYRVIMRVLETIDVLPRQVLIEATIAEIDYSLISELGVNWEYLKGADFATGLVNLLSSGDTGLRVAVGLSSKLRVALNALEQENRANIINSPHILASDNQEARIDVSTEVPIVSAETVIPSGGESIVTTTVQYRDTGVLLTVIPHINDRKLVTLDIRQEVSEQVESVLVAGQLYPSFFKRVVQTSLTVEHGQTIVLGGLIRENSSKGTSGVPCLARLPIFGPIFGTRRDVLDKTELIILLTPNVMVSLDEVDSVTDGFKSKVESVLKELYKKRSVPYSPLLDEVFDGGN
jgi:general secretion pathway protein D